MSQMSIKGFDEKEVTIEVTISRPCFDGIQIISKSTDVPFDVTLEGLVGLGAISTLKDPGKFTSENENLVDRVTAGFQQR